MTSNSKASNLDLAVSQAQESDVGGIQILLNHYASMGELLPRTKTDLSLIHI